MSATVDPSILTAEYIAYTNAPELLTQFGALFGVATVIVLLRCYVRAVMIKSFGKDDWLMLLALAFSAATFATYVAQTKVGMGKHYAVIKMNPTTYKEFLKLRQVSSVLAQIGVTVVKISVVYFLLRLVVHRKYVFFLHGLNIFTILFSIACVGTLVVTIATDFIVAILPIPLVWKLQLNLRARLCLVFILTLGFFAAIAAIIKTQIQKTFYFQPDPFAHDVMTLWRFIEFDVGIIAASLPALKPLFNWALGAARGLTTRAGRGTSGPNSLGYRKHSERSDRGIALNDYNAMATNSVRISSRPAYDQSWSTGQPKGSDESILPLHNLEEKSNTIVVTRDVHVS